MSKYPQTGLEGVTAADLSWMAGQWRGLRGEEEIEEHWSEPRGGAMMGMFRWLRDGRVWFFEFLTLEQQGECVLMRIKHYYPGLIGWEEKDSSVEFLLVQLGEREAVFWQLHKPYAPWIIYRREGAQRMITYFEREDKDVTAEEIFSYSLIST